MLEKIENLTIGDNQDKHREFIPGRLSDEEIEKIIKDFNLVDSDGEFFVIKAGDKTLLLPKREYIHVELGNRKLGRLNIRSAIQLTIEYPSEDIKESMAKSGKSFDKIVLKPEPKPKLKSQKDRPWRFEDHFSDWGKVKK